VKREELKIYIQKAIDSVSSNDAAIIKRQLGYE
jgi:hypothetical protein